MRNSLLKKSFFSIATIIIFAGLTLSGCKNADKKEKPGAITEEQLIEINRELVIKERERIENYIARKGLDLQMSDAGIWYTVIREGEGTVLHAGNNVRLEYTCSLLDGTLCYSSDINGDIDLVIGQSDIPTGLDEALRMLKVNSEAIIILPSNLAYGLLGDGKKIPSRSALVYKIKVFQGL